MPATAAAADSIPSASIFAIAIVTTVSIATTVATDTTKLASSSRTAGTSSILALTQRLVSPPLPPLQRKQEQREQQGTHKQRHCFAYHALFG